MTEPNSKYLTPETPTIVLAGKAWPVLNLSIRQQRTVLPAILQFMPWLDTFTASQRELQVIQAKVQKAKDDLDEEAEKTATVEVKEKLEQLGRIYATMSETHLAALYDAVHGALLKAHPGLTKAEFEEMEVTLVELISAMPVIINASGLFRAATAGEVQPGEVVTQA